MEERFIDEMNKKLLQQKEEIMQMLMAESAEFQNLVKEMDPKDLADIAADDIDRNTLDALGAQETKRLRLIDSALSRVKNGRFGLCIKCNKKIPEARLEAIPYALMCVSCQALEERKNR